MPHFTDKETGSERKSHCFSVLPLRLKGGEDAPSRFPLLSSCPAHSASWPRPPPYPHSRVVLGQVNTLPMHCSPYPPSSGALAAGTPNLHWQRRLHSCPHSGEAALRTLSVQHGSCGQLHKHPSPNKGLWTSDMSRVWARFLPLGQHFSSLGRQGTWKGEGEVVKG